MVGATFYRRTVERIEIVRVAHVARHFGKSVSRQLRSGQLVFDTLDTSVMLKDLPYSRITSFRSRTACV